MLSAILADGSVRLTTKIAKLVFGERWLLEHSQAEQPCGFHRAMQRTAEHCLHGQRLHEHCSPCCIGFPLGRQFIRLSIVDLALVRGRLCVAQEIPCSTNRLARSQPFSTPIGISLATGFARPASETTRTTSSTSLYACGASSTSPLLEEPRT